MLRTVCPSCPNQRTISTSSAGTQLSDAASSSPLSPKPRKLGMADVANLLVRVRRAENRLPSRQRPDQQKLRQIISTSGEPKTHPAVQRCMQPDQPHTPVEFAESYVCSGGVNVVPLLVATRLELLDRVEAALGAGTLTDEQYVAHFLLGSLFLLLTLMIPIDGNVSLQHLSVSQTVSIKSKYGFPRQLSKSIAKYSRRCDTRLARPGPPQGTLSAQYASTKPGAFLDS